MINIGIIMYAERDVIFCLTIPFFELKKIKIDKQKTVTAKRPNPSFFVNIARPEKTALMSKSSLFLSFIQQNR